MPDGAVHRPPAAHVPESTAAGPGHAPAGADACPPCGENAPRPGGLTAAQLDALQSARRDGRRIARAAFVASFSGWTLVIFALCSLVGGLFSVASLLLGLGLSVVAVVELRGARALRRLDLGAPRRLCCNQLALAAMLGIYGSWGIVRALTGPGPYDEHLAGGGDMAEMLEPIAALHTMVAVAVYAGVIVGGLFAAGGTSAYYLSRRSRLRAYVERTPEWVVATLRTVG